MNLKNAVSKYFVLTILFLVFFLNACKKKDDPTPAPIPKNSEPATSQYIYDLMKEVYLWYDKVPASFNVNNYKNAKETLDLILYKVLDRWSFIADAKELDQLLQEGQSVSYGYSLAQDPIDYSIKVAFVYKDSPMAKAGVERGYTLISLNYIDVGTLISNGKIYSELDKPSNIFEFEDTLGNSVILNISQSLININTVLHKEVINVGTKKVGYLVFNSFLGTSEAELNDAFSYFTSNGVNELILDLRYNGGGSVDVAIHLAGLLAPSHAGKTFVTMNHNKNLADHDTTYLIKSVAGGIDLAQLIVITTGSTASASELIINGLKPYIPVKLVGTRTHGKPVGMYVFYSPDKKYAIVPICFAGKNANGEGGFYSGIGVDSHVKDNLSKPFGNPQEDCLKEALYYIQNNKFNGLPARLAVSEPVIELKGLNAEAGCF